jgi:hypothetical protein
MSMAETVGRIFHWIFGGCQHDWSKWRQKYEYSIFYVRTCSKCGDIQEKMM